MDPVTHLCNLILLLIPSLLTLAAATAISEMARPVHQQYQHQYQHQHQPAKDTETIMPLSPLTVPNGHAAKFSFPTGVDTNSNPAQLKGRKVQVSDYTNFFAGLDAGHGDIYIARKVTLPSGQTTPCTVTLMATDANGTALPNYSFQLNFDGPPGNPLAVSIGDPAVTIVDATLGIPASDPGSDTLTIPD